MFHTCFLLSFFLSVAFTKSDFMSNLPISFSGRYSYSQLMSVSGSKTVNACQTKLTKPTNDKSHTMALVVYDDSKVLPVHKPSREFTFVGRKIVIRQSWNDLGVSAVVWDSAVVLSEYLESHPSFVKDRRVLELGAGTGLVSIVAAYLGAYVTATERSLAISHLNKVISTNTDPTIHHIHTQELDWTDTNEPTDQSYDVILGADIIYIEDVFDDLLRTLVKYSSRDTRVFLSCKIRYDRDTRFLNLLKQVFNVQGIFYDNTRDIRIYEAKLL